MPSGAAVGVAESGAKKKGFRPDVQGLRMVAVLAVIADHLFHWPTGGFVGVDVFFVISGFLITSLLLREHEKTGTISFWGFYRRRIKRIVPAATLVILATITAAWFIFNRVRFEQTVGDGIWATLFSANWHFAVQGTDYFGADAAVSPLQHYWSLSVEEQFYFVWPWLMLLIFWVVASLKGTRRHARGIVLFAIGAISIASFAWALYETASQPTWAYFSTFSRTWELGIGALIAVIAPVFARIPDWARPLLAWIGLAGIVAGVFTVTAGPGFPAPWALLPVLSTALVIVAGTGGPVRYLWPITNPASTFIGNISYSLYLWHFPVIILAGEFFPVPDVTYYVVTIVGMFVLAIGSYYGVEDPIRRSALWEPKQHHHHHHRRHRRYRRAGASVPQLIGVGALAAVVAVLVVVAIQPRTPPASAHRSPAATTAATEAPDAAPQAQLASLQAELTTALNATEWPALSPTVDELGTIDFESADANGCAPANPKGKDCASIQTADPTRTVLVVGNSIAVAWLPTIRAVFEPRGWEVVALTMIGCPFVDADTKNADAGVTAACGGHKDIVVDTINRIHPALVISSNVYGTNFQDNAGYKDDASHWGAATSGMLERIAGGYGEFVILSQPPAGKDPVECATRVSTPDACAFSVPDNWMSFSRAEQSALPAEGAAYLDTREWFCVQGRCPAFAGGTMIKRDATHLTPQYAQKVAPLLAEMLTSRGIITE